jgi:hypothetical protein
MERLARFTDTTLHDPEAFGGGSDSAHVRTRVAAVAYGYLGVLEEYEQPHLGTTWCTLTLTLPGLAPYVVADHRSVLGRPGVPAAGTPVATGDAVFDATYAVVSDNPASAAHVLTAPVRQLLVSNPLQRLALSGGSMILRTFDGVDATDTVVGWLSELVEAILSSTPSFVTPRSGHQIGQQGRPLPPGLNGPDEPESEEPAGSERAGLARRMGRSRHRD